MECSERVSVLLALCCTELTLCSTDPAQEDTYLLAMFLFVLFNPEKPLPNFSAAPTPASAGQLPKRLFPLWKRMLNPNAKTRLSTINFVAEVVQTGFWNDNPLVQLVDGLDGFELRSDGEKNALLRTIKDAAEGGSLPEPFLVHRVLPSLLHSLSLPNAPSALMLPLVLALGRQVPPSTYGKVILDPVVKLYASPDRGTRMALLDGLDEYADKLDSRTTVDRVWPNLITGFADTVPVIREATIKAVFPLAGKLSDRILNNDLLRLLAKMQTDQEASIRTNTCILLGRLAPMLGPNTKKKVLVPAFARSLKDPFVHARVAALMALMATVDCFDRDDLAARVIPNMAFALVDKEKVVRDQAFKAMAMFMKRLEEYATTLPTTMIREDSPNALGSGYTNGNGAAGAPASGGGTALVSSAAGAAGSLAGWAFSSLSKQLATTEANSTMTAAPAQVQALTPSANTPDTSRRPSADSVTASFSRPAPSPLVSSFGQSSSGGARTSASKPAVHGMKLGGGPKKTQHSAFADIADEVAGEWDDDDEVANAWGNDDLMDVNADNDDWSELCAPRAVTDNPTAAFESAPAPEIAVPPPRSYYVTPAPPKPTPKAAPAPKVHAPTPVKVKPTPTTTAPAPTPAAAAAPSSVASPRSSISESSKPASPAPPSLASMSKEEKDKEMARRREERKARIAAMKKGKA